MRHRNPRLTACAAMAMAVLIPLTASCGAVGKAIDCGQLAIDITADAQQLSEALSNAGEDPQAAKDALDELDRDLDKLEGKTGDADVKAAVENLNDQVTEVRDALNAGEVPSGKPIVDAAGELADVCSPG